MSTQIKQLDKAPPDILSRLRGVRQNGSGWTARCPAHEDRRASLSVGLGDDGRTLVHCHAGCSPESVMSAIGLTMQDLMPSDNDNGRPKGKPQIVASYDYRDEYGELLFQVVRMAPKSFRQRRPKPGGGWLWNLQGVRRVLYRLPELVEADPADTVYVLRCA